MRKNISVVIFLLIFTAAFYYPIIKNIKTTIISEDDWFGNYFYAGLSRATIVNHAQLPLRTPYLSGGYPSIAHPFDYSFNPFLLFILPFGEAAGLRIQVFLIFLLGAWGMFYLARNILKFNLLGAFFAAAVFVFCNWGAYEVTDGNIQKIYYYLLPWLLVFFERAKEDRRFILFSCLLVSFFLMNSGLSSIPVLLFLFIYACLGSISLGRRFKIKLNTSVLALLLTITVLSFLLSAVKLFPMYKLYLLREGYIHLPYENNYTQVSIASDAFHASLNMERLWRGLFTGYLGYSSMYLGYLPVIIAFFSILIYFRKNLRYLILLSAFTLITFGRNSPFDIFKIIWNIHPVVHGIWRLDKYFCFFIPFLIAIIAGRFFLIVDKRRKLYLFAVLLAIISVANIYIKNKSVFQNMAYENKPDLKQYSNFFQVKIEDAIVKREMPGFFDIKDLRDYQPFWLLLNQKVGVVDFNWAGNFRIKENAIPRYILPVGKQTGRGKTVFVEGYESLSREPSSVIDLVSAGKVNPDYKGEVFLLNSAHSVNLDYFSPNAIKVTVDLKRPDTLVINQNYHESWRVDRGVLTEYKGLLAVELKEAGRYKIELKYIPKDFYIGLMISLFTAIMIVIYCIKASPGNKKPLKTG